MRNKILVVLTALVLCLSCTSISANTDEDYDETSYEETEETAADETEDEAEESEPEDTDEESGDNIESVAPAIPRTISTDGNGHVVDDVKDEDSESLQFITVTARDGSIFYVVIDRKNSSDNVYFLNEVDTTDIEALTEDYNAPAAPAPTPTAAPGATAAPTPEPSAPVSSGGSGNILILILVLAVLGGAAAYYFKIYLPKKKLEDADDIEDFEFVDNENRENEYNSEEYTEDE